MGQSLTVSEINGDFGGKLQMFPTPVYFAPPLKGFSLELGNSAGVSQKLEWLATGSRKKFDDIFSLLDTVHQRDRRTDRWTDTRRQQRPRWRIASRGKNRDLGKPDVYY